MWFRGCLVIIQKPCHRNMLINSKVLYFRRTAEGIAMKHL